LPLNLPLLPIQIDLRSSLAYTFAVAAAGSFVAAVTVVAVAAAAGVMSRTHNFCRVGRFSLPIALH
jgi:putative exporter of polyketide antibiotics